MNYELKLNAHSDGVTAIDAQHVFVVDTQRAVDDARVDHRRQSAVAGDGSQVVHRGRDSESLQVFRPYGHRPTNGHIVDVHIVAVLGCVISIVLRLDSNTFLIDWIPWALLSCVIIMCVTVKTHTPIRRSFFLEILLQKMIEVRSTNIYPIIVTIQVEK